MIDPRKIEEIANKVNDVIPPGLKAVGEDLERKVKQVLQNQLQKLDVVPRDEFDVQTEVLMRTREKLQALEARLTELEKKLQNNQE